MEWRKCVEFPEYFMVSDTGLIKSVDRLSIHKDGHKKRLFSKILTPKKDKDGYLYIGLRINRQRYWRRVSRIVCAAFHENPESKPMVNHKNGIKDDNKKGNLEWATASENELHSFRVLGKMPNRTGLGKTGKLNPDSLPLYQYDLNGKLVKEWDSMGLAISAGFTDKSIRLVMRGQQSHHKGFLWSR